MEQENKLTCQAQGEWSNEPHAGIQVKRNVFKCIGHV